MSLREILLGFLKRLNDMEFKEFKWHLQEEPWDDYPAIPKNRLDKADRMDTVDQMVQTYSRNSVEVTQETLRKINRNDLADEMSDDDN